MSAGGELGARRGRVHRWVAAALAAGAVGPAAVAAGPQAPSERAARWSLDHQAVALPASETLGLSGLAYTVELAPGWWAGPAIYGASTGRRGGLFTWGAELQRSLALAPGWRAAAGLYVGGGGGAAAPVGGGLMLRPHLDLLRELRPGLELGIGLSQVRFPSGDIGASQAALLLAIDDRFGFASAQGAPRVMFFDGPGGAGIDHVAVTAGRQSHVRSGGASLGTAGLRVERSLGGGLAAVGIAGGAASGGSDGYAEFLAGLQRLWVPQAAPAWRAGGGAALGLAGGGGVPTGGGVVGRVFGLVRWQSVPSPAGGVAGSQPFAQLEFGHTRVLESGRGSPYGQFAVGFALGPPTGAGAADGLGSPRDGGLQRVHDMEWAVSLQSWPRAARKTGGEPPIGLIGLKFRRSEGASLYLTGQGLGAITGGAGAFSVGLVGVGGALPRETAAPWRAGIEATAGAAGGGGIAVKGGAVIQAMAWVARDLGPHARLQAGAGRLRALRGGLDTPVLELALGLEFAAP